MKRLRLTALLTFLFFGATHAQNQVVNGTFDASGANWSYWGTATGTEAYLYETTYGGTVSTNHVAEVDDGANLQQTITVVPGQAYTLSFIYSRRNIAPNPITTNLFVVENGGNLVNTTFSATNTAWNWQCYTTTFTPATNSVTLQFSDATASFTTLGMIVDNITVSPTTSQTITATPQTLCAGGTTTLSAPSFPADPNTNYSNYSWTGPNGYTANTATTTLTGVTPAQSGTYTATMQLNNSCLSVSGSVVVTVVPTVADTQQVAICQGGAYTYAGTNYNTAGYYSFHYTNAGGCDSVHTFNLTVNPSYHPVITQTICHGQSYTLGSQSYNSSGTYIDTLATVAGCDSIITLQLTVSLPITYNSIINICQGQNYVFNGNPLNTSGNYIDTFTTGGGCDSIVFLNLIVHPVYTGNAPNDTICVGMSAPLCVNVSQPAGVIFTVSWAANPASPIGNPFSPCTTGQPAVDTRYIATIIPDGLAACAVNDTVDVKVLQGFDISNGDTSICLGSTVKINGTSDILYTYFWSPSAGVSNVTAFNPQITPDTTHTYTITASYPGCPDSSQSITITVEPVPTVFAGSDTVLCYGTRYSIPATVTPAFPLYTYTWTPDSALDNGHILNPVFTAKDTATLTLIIATPAGCQNRDSLKILVIPQHFFTLSNDTAICPGDSAILKATLINGITSANLMWTPYFHLSDSADTLVYATPPYQTQYTVYAAEVHGCRDTDKVTVNIHPKALLSLPDSTTLYPGDSYQMNPQGNCLYFNWFPLLGLDNPNVSNPVAQPPVNTRYYVAATTEEGCSTHDSIDVYVIPDFRIDVPNAFTPGNGPNSNIKPVHMGTATLVSFRVFDRWGLEVFESNSIEDGWDGTYKGTPQPMGVYMYVVTAMTYQGKSFYKQGNITLLR